MLASSTALPPAEVRPRLSITIPGFGGDRGRAKVIERNFLGLRKQPIEITHCNIYLYESHVGVCTNTMTNCTFPKRWDPNVHQAGLYGTTLDTAFGLLPEAAQSGCSMVRSGVGHWLHHLIQHSFDASTVDFVLVLIDSVELHPNVDWNRMARIMLANCLGLVSPACTGCPAKKIIEPDRRYNTSSTAGRLVEFVEVQVTMMTPAAFECWKYLTNQMIHIDPYGWSISRFLAPVCGFRQGIVDQMTVSKRFTSAIGGKSKTVSYSWKWAATFAVKGKNCLHRHMPDLLSMGHADANASSILGPLLTPDGSGSHMAPRAWHLDPSCADLPVCNPLTWPKRRWNGTHSVLLAKAVGSG